MIVDCLPEISQRKTSLEILEKQIELKLSISNQNAVFNVCQRRREEISRKITITSAFSFCSWDGHRINLIDTPGFINFVEDTRGSLKAVDGAVVIVSALSGVKAETEKVWEYACEYEIPKPLQKAQKRKQRP